MTKLITDYRKEPMDSVNEVRKMLEADPENPDLLDWMAFVYYTNDMWDSAISIYRKLLQQGFRPASQRLYLGNSLYKKGLLTAAIAEWEQAATMDPDGTVGKKARARLEDARSHQPP